jgi:SAM-dependent methyltransferase
MTNAPLQPTRRSARSHATDFGSGARRSDVTCARRREWFWSTSARGPGQFAAAFSDWFDLSVLAVEPSAAMRDRIPRTPAIQVLEGNASALPLPDESADAAWLSLVIHHIPDLEAAAQEIRRVVRPGGPVLIRQGFPGRLDGVELVRWFPEPVGLSMRTLPSRIRATRSRPRDSTRTPSTRFVRRTRPASRTSSARWTASATPTPRCAISLRTSSSAVRNASAAPYDMPRTQRIRKPEATGLTSCFCADRFVRKGTSCSSGSVRRSV